MCILRANQRQRQREHVSCLLSAFPISLSLSVSVLPPLHLTLLLSHTRSDSLTTDDKTWISFRVQEYVFITYFQSTNLLRWIYHPELVCAERERRQILGQLVVAINGQKSADIIHNFYAASFSPLSSRFGVCWQLRNFLLHSIASLSCVSQALPYYFHEFNSIRFLSHNNGSCICDTALH